METSDIADTLKLTSQLMELHNENPFKIKSLANAAFRLSKTNINLEGLSLADLEKIEGIGKGIAQKINELNTIGQLKELNELLSKTPEGVLKMLSIKGIGPKKIALLWKELKIESIGELLYACDENRLIDLKGFGTKTQEQVKKSIEFNIAAQGKYHYARIESYAYKLVEELKKKLNNQNISITGAVRRKCEIIEKIEILIASENNYSAAELIPEPLIPVEIINCSKNTFYETLLETTATQDHLSQLGFTKTNGVFDSEEAVYKNYSVSFIEPELREGLGEIDLAKKNAIPQLIEFIDLKGILHNHTNYSDGVNTLEEMAQHCKELGYEYLGICDHSQSAVYANGLKPERILEQHAEIDLFNKKLSPFKILKGIESDILNDGSLDYDEDILKTFDLVVASVHSNLKMDKEKATQRLIRAVENPYTTILGHPSGRLLLSRDGYPLDYKKIIDACAANKVVIELNAHPYRLDIDWRWIYYCLEKNVMISINPDAHEKQGYQNMYYGVCAARKGMLTKEMCFNAKSLKELEIYLEN